MPQFLEKVRGLGFQSCSREPGSWKVRVSWKMPDAMLQRQRGQQNGKATNGQKERRGASRGPSVTSDADNDPAPANGHANGAAANNASAAALPANGAARGNGSAPVALDEESGTEDATAP